MLRVEGDHIVFNPSGTNYELLLKGTWSGPSPVGGGPVTLIIRAQGRKLLTVPSGGNFVAPIFGPPKTVQGRVRFVDGTTVVVHAGVPVVVKLPGEESAIDLNNGQITVGQMVNVIVLPGATFEVVK